MTDTATEQLVEFDLLIGGESSAAATGSTYDSVDPFTGRPWARVPDGGVADVDRAVAAARAALNGPWGSLSATAASWSAKWSARCGRFRTTTSTTAGWQTSCRATSYRWISPTTSFTPAMNPSAWSARSHPGTLRFCC